MLSNIYIIHIYYIIYILYSPKCIYEYIHFFICKIGSLVIFNAWHCQWYTLNCKLVKKKKKTKKNLHSIQKYHRNSTAKIAFTKRSGNRFEATDTA